jgi:hypothetical protein
MKSDYSVAVAFFFPGRAKDLSAPRYISVEVLLTGVLASFSLLVDISQ